MNVQEWYKQIWASNVPLQFASEQLAERDVKIASLQDGIGDGAAHRAHQAMKIVNQRSMIEALQRTLADERVAHLETKQKLEAAEKRGAVAMSRLIENWLTKEYIPKVSAGFEADVIQPGDTVCVSAWTQRAYAAGWGSSGKQEAAFRPLTRIERRAEARRCRDAGIKPLPGTYGEDDLRELEIFEQVKRETPECNQGEGCPTCNTIAAKRFEELRLAREQQAGSAQTASDWGSGSCGESAAEDEARETESLAHRIEKLENGRRYDNQCAVEKMLDAEKRLGMHDTQFRRTTERFDRHAKKLIELDGEIRHARDSRRKMHAQIGALESRVKEHADSFATRINYVEGTAFERIVDIHKTAEADRVEFRAADAAVHERVAKLAERIGSLEAHRNGRTVG
jgi:DNA-binding ferritin-like protein